MSTQQKLIVDQMTTLIQAVPGIPSLIKWMKEESWQTGEPDAVIISGGPNRAWQRYFGGIGNRAGTLWEYRFQVGVFTRQAQIRGASDGRPVLMRAISDALSVSVLPGTTVWDFDLATNPDWELNSLGGGAEVSRFGILYRTSEI